MAEADDIIVNYGNHIWIKGIIDENAEKKIVNIIKKLNKTIKDKSEIYMNIKSKGGYIFNVIEVILAMDKSKIKINTVIHEYCMGASMLISISANTRYMMPKSIISMSPLTNQDDKIMDVIAEYICEKTVMKLNTVRLLLAKGDTWNFNICFKNGLVDKIR
jgi:hypothetical protein